MRDVAIAAYNLSKRYPGTKKYALKGLDFDIRTGEVYGFLGPNGAGKTTTLRLFMNFIQPTLGEAKVLDMDSVVESVEVKSRIGYLPGEMSFYSKMTGGQFLQYMAQLQPPKNIAYARQLIRLFEFGTNQKIGQLSKGNRQKLGIIAAFMHQPEVLFLDEPTSGLDPLMQEAFFELVRRTKAGGATLFISSHNLGEVQKMCDRVGFIRQGRLIAEQKVGDFSKLTKQIYDISFADKAPLDDLRSVPKAKVTVNTPHYVTVQVMGDLTPLFKVLARHKVNTMDRREASLEEEFLRFYRKDNK